MFSHQEDLLMEDMVRTQIDLQHYYQFQTILKPSPDNIQELYLQSLNTLGIDSKKNDIRFVEDDWESPTLRCMGLGLGSLV